MQERAEKPRGAGGKLEALKEKTKETSRALNCEEIRKRRQRMHGQGLCRGDQVKVMDGKTVLFIFIFHGLRKKEIKGASFCEDIRKKTKERTVKVSASLTKLK